LQLRSPILVDLPLLFINESILTAGMPISSPLRLLISSLRRNPNIKFMVDHPKVERLGVQLIFNENVIKSGNNEEYIEEAVNIIVILCAK